VLIHVPPDSGGLWIDRGAAAVLNARDAQHMRDGFRTATFNSRGAHVVDPAAAPELELAADYRRKAEEIENAGFQRFASMLRELAAWYERDCSTDRGGVSGPIKRADLSVGPLCSPHSYTERECDHVSLGPVE
jgi:hypothetical protein